jgi:hypothetical protein
LAPTISFKFFQRGAVARTFSIYRSEKNFIGVVE